jgi:hypothetical protein
MVKSKNIIIICAGLLFLSLLITGYLFLNFNENNLLVVHDTLSVNSAYSFFNNSLIIKPPFYNGFDMFQAVNPYQFLITDLFQVITHAITGVSFGQTTIILYFFIQTAILILSFLGIYFIYYEYVIDKRLLKKEDYFIIIIATLFYFINPFNITNINNGIFFSISYISYGAIPLFVYYLLKLIKSNITNIELICLIFMSSMILFHITYVIPIIFLSIILIGFHFSQIKWKYFINRTIIIVPFLIIIGLPTIIPFLVQAKDQSFVANNLINSTNNLVQGGILTILKGHYHWPIYTSWTPKSLYTFSTYIDGPLFILSSLSIYIVIMIASINKNIQSKIFPYIATLIIGIFFSKGPLPPFGGIYSFLLDNISLFGAVRSPDNKFSVLIPITVIIIFLYIFSSYNKKTIKYVFGLYIIFLVILFSYPFLTKEVVLSKDNYPNSGSYVFDVPQEYTDIVTYLNEDKDFYKVLSLPESGGFRVYDTNKKLYIGRDIIATLIRENPVYYDSLQDDLLKQFVETKDINVLQNTNIKYILIRKDLFDKKEEIDKMFKLVESTESKKIIDNQYLTLYKVPDEIFTPKIVLPDNQEYSFTKTNITQYNISLKGIKDTTLLNFLEGFNKQYKLYLDNQNSNIQHYNDTQFKYATQRDTNILFQKPLFEDTHKLVYDYANQWTIDPEYIKANFDKSMYKENLDGSIDLELTLYFKPQSYFYLGIIISGTTLILCLGYLGYYWVRRRGAKLSPHPAPPK